MAQKTVRVELNQVADLVCHFEDTNAIENRRAWITWTTPDNEGWSERNNGTLQLTVTSKCYTHYRYTAVNPSGPGPNTGSVDLEISGMF